ncbi:hypothetical protein LX36DRAFT_320727 [Colletotrichum falcatum]|nr:hypothetical protein LX36DRAFT_320727 [Colletotrichum falcatum]
MQTHGGGFPKGVKHSLHGDSQAVLSWRGLPCHMLLPPSVFLCLSLSLSISLHLSQSLPHGSAGLVVPTDPIVTTPRKNPRRQTKPSRLVGRGGSLAHPVGREPQKSSLWAWAQVIPGVRRSRGARGAATSRMEPSQPHPLE